MGQISPYIAYGVYASAGLQLAGAVVAGIFLGNYIDMRIGSSPWLAITGSILGAVGGFWNLVRILNWQQKKTR